MIGQPSDPATPAEFTLPTGLEVLHPAATVARTVQRLGREIRDHYGDRQLLMVAIMDGALIFAADLLRHLPPWTHLATMRASSYRAGARRPGTLELAPDPPNIGGRHLLLVDDIIDTGQTLDRIRRRLLDLEPASLEICVLLNKEQRRQVQVPLAWVGLHVPDRFVVGYGLDDHGRHRNLPCIAAVVDGDGAR